MEDLKDKMTNLIKYYESKHNDKLTSEEITMVNSFLNYNIISNNEIINW